MKSSNIAVSEENATALTRSTGIWHAVTTKLKPYVEYIKKTCVWLNRLANQEHLNFVWVYWDYLWAVALHRNLYISLMKSRSLMPISSNLCIEIGYMCGQLQKTN